MVKGRKQKPSQEDVRAYLSLLKEINNERNKTTEKREITRDKERQ